MAETLAEANMKTKLAILVLGAMAALASVAQAGPKAGIFINTGNRGSCAPAARFCPPVTCQPLPAWYGSPRPAFYSWGPTMVVASTGYGSGFTTVSSPVVTSTPVIRVAPPVVPAPPLSVYPATTFRWKN